MDVAQVRKGEPNLSNSHRFRWTSTATPSGWSGFGSSVVAWPKPSYYKALPWHLIKGINMRWLLAPILVLSFLGGASKAQQISDPVVLFNPHGSMADMMKLWDDDAPWSEAMKKT